MLQVAGIVVGDAEIQGLAGGARLEFGEDFTNVFALCRKSFCAICIGGIVTQQMAVLFYV